jgi:uncharacterized membrane protein
VLTKRIGLIALAIFAMVVMCTISAVVGGALSHSFGTSSYTISYADFISVMLTAVSVLLTLVTIFLAVVGVLGWTAIANGVRARTEDFLEEGFKKGNPLYAMVETRVTEITYAGISAVGTNPEADDTTDDEEAEQ